MADQALLPGKRNELAMNCRSSHSRHPGALAFTLTELLAVVGVLGLLVLTGLPALCRTQAPVNLARCMNNCRQLAAAALLYRADNGDGYPLGTRFQSILQPTAWPMQLLPYLGATTNVQPLAFICPSESGTNSASALQLHYQGNRMLLGETSDRDSPLRGAQVRKPAIYWLFMEKGPWDIIDVRPGGLANPILAGWNVPPGNASYRRHSGGATAAAADGHAEWLRMPPYQPGRPAPQGFPELGDCADGHNPASSWSDGEPFGMRIKLYSRYSQAGF
jgi:prepilin-type processing-associated H-X9-DG protein